MLIRNTGTNMVKYLTSEGLQKLKKELDHLKNVKRKEVAERIKYAASFGDISENAAYDEAKEAQAFVEGRIQELKEIISQAKIIKKENGGKVGLGSIVQLKSNDEKEKFQIVGEEEIDIQQGKISHQSPLGKALLGKTKGEKIKIKTPNGSTEYKILKIE